MRTWTALAATIAAAGGLAAAAGIAGAQHRQAGAHEHGRGTLNIALEGSRLTMELEAPGADIVGFEHKANTEQQTAAIEKAEQQLMVAEALFQLPAAAGCVLETSSAALEGDGHDHANDHGHGKGHGKDHDTGHDNDHEHHNDKADHAEHEHSGFRAEYAFNCKAPASLTSIGFDYFKVFAGAQKLAVTVVTPKGQSSFEVSRAKPRIDLGGVM